MPVKYTCDIHSPQQIENVSSLTAAAESLDSPVAALPPDRGSGDAARGLALSTKDRSGEAGRASCSTPQPESAAGTATRQCDVNVSDCSREVVSMQLL